MRHLFSDIRATLRPIIRFQVADLWKGISMASHARLSHWRCQQMSVRYRTPVGHIVKRYHQSSSQLTRPSLRRLSSVQISADFPTVTADCLHPVCSLRAIGDCCQATGAARGATWWTVLASWRHRRARSRPWGLARACKWRWVRSRRLCRRFSPGTRAPAAEILRYILLGAGQRWLVSSVAKMSYAVSIK